MKKMITSLTHQHLKDKPIKYAQHGLFILLILIITSFSGYAQAPTSLSYPTPNGFIANVTSVYLAPTLTGSTTNLAYAITPTLPAGLNFNPGTGVISGLPTAASVSTNYTVTATNPLGSTDAVINITVSNTFFNNNYSSIRFKTSGGSADTLRKVGNGQNVGDIVIYRNVSTNTGIPTIDCIVKTTSVNNVNSWSAYDQQAITDNSTFNDNNQDFFSPQLEFGNGGGSVVFEFQFIAGGSYNNATQKGLNITLQNVKLNTYDIDGNGTSGSNQFNKFDGFSTSELSANTRLKSPVYDAATGTTKFESDIDNNISNVTDEDTRVRLNYDNISNFRIEVGAGAVGLAYFFLDFSSGPTFTTPVPSTPPTIDLNLNTPGTGNGDYGCATSLSFSAASQANVGAGSNTNFKSLEITYNNTSSNLKDGNDEILSIVGSTGGTSTYAFDGSFVASNVIIGGKNYNVTKSSSGTTSTISFKKGNSSFSLAQAEALVDALRYENTNEVPTAGDRVFIVNIRNSQFTSPDAVFTATLNCVSISGNIWHDVNGQTDDLVNASANGTTGTIKGQFSAGTTSKVYAVLTNPANNKVIDIDTITAGGAYSFGRTEPGTYNIFVSNTSPVVGATFNAATYPAGGYKSTGEHLGLDIGTDGLTDGKLQITLGTVPVTNANFGVQIPPATNNYAFASQPNPGGFNNYSIPTTPTTGFLATDADGAISKITITAFPTGANYLKVGNTYYTTNGSTCPPQVASCTAWPGTLDIPWTNINTLSVDPTLPGNTTVVITFKATDNGDFNSNNGGTSTVTIPFTASTLSVSGNVWNDANGDGVKAAAEPYTNAAKAGETLYAVLVQTTKAYAGNATIYASTPITSAAIGYTFTEVPPNNGYEVRIVSRLTAPTAGAAFTTITPSLAPGYVGVSTNNSGVIAPNQNTNNLINSLGTVTTNKINVNFGIERLPVSDNKSYAVSNAAFSTTPPTGYPSINAYRSIPTSSNSLTGYPNLGSLTATDAEDCAVSASCNSGKIFQVESVYTTTMLYYNNGAGPVLITAGTKLMNFDPAKLVVYGKNGSGTAASPVGFTYTLVDAAGRTGAPAFYKITTTVPLPVTLISFEATADKCMVNLHWTTANEREFDYFDVQYSDDAKVFTTIGKVAGKAEDRSNEYNFTTTQTSEAGYYRLSMVDLNGSHKLSNTLSVKTKCTGDLMQWNAYPNPSAPGSNANLYVANNTSVNKEIRAVVISIVGQKLIDKAITVHPGVNNVMLFETGWATGSYMIGLFDENGNPIGSMQRLLVK